MTTIQQMIEDCLINRGLSAPPVTTEEVLQRWDAMEEGNTSSEVTKDGYMDLQAELIWALVLYAAPQLQSLPPQDLLDQLLERQGVERTQLQRRQARERVESGFYVEKDGVQTAADGLNGPLIILGR